MASTPKNFEQLMSQLQAHYELLDSGQLDLEKSLTTYEESMTMIKACQQQLHEAEKRIEAVRYDSNTAHPIENEDNMETE